MAVRLTTQLCRALHSLTVQPQISARCLTISSARLLKRPTFDGPQLPKRPPNAYALFVMDNMGYARMADSGRLDIKKLGEMWKSLSEGERNAYKVKYEEEKRVHNEKVEEFMLGLGGKEEQDAYLKALAEYKAKRRAYLKNFRLKKLGLLKPRRRSGYQVFASERLREAGGEGEGLNIPLIKEIPLFWKALPTEEKERYQKVADEQYTTRLTEYTQRLQKAQEEGILSPALLEKEDKKPVKKKTLTTKKRTSAKKKTKSATKKKASRSKKAEAKTTSTSKKETKSVDDDDDWISSDDED